MSEGSCWQGTPGTNSGGSGTSGTGGMTWFGGPTMDADPHQVCAAVTLEVGQSRVCVQDARRVCGNVRRVWVCTLRC